MLFLTNFSSSFFLCFFSPPKVTGLDWRFTAMPRFQGCLFFWNAIIQKRVFRVKNTAFVAIVVDFFYHREHWDSGFAVSIFDHSTSHRNIMTAQQKTALWKCNLCMLPLLFNSIFFIFLDSVNLEKHNIRENAIDIFLKYCGVFMKTNFFFYWSVVMKKQQLKQLTKG